MSTFGRKLHHWSIAAFAMLAVMPAQANQPPHTDITKVQASDLPADVLAVVKAAVPDMKIAEAELKVRGGRHYYDVEGSRADGTEIELDLLKTPKGWTVVEIQRDISWKDAPAPVRQAAKTAKIRFEPARVIESRQTTGPVIYELFAPGKPKDPAAEIKLENGKATMLTEVWPH